jgi:hypothetical protein
MAVVETLTEPIHQELTKLANLPAPVRRWEINIGEDASGEQAVWVWAVLDDANLTRDIRNRLRERIESVVHRLVPNASWVYVRFRATSEEA